MQFWNIVYLAGWLVYVTIRGVFKQRTRANQIDVGRVDAVEKALLAIVIPGGLLLPLVYLFTHWLGFADYRLPAAAHWIGLPLMVAGLWLFYRAHSDLGLNWSQSLEIRKGHELITRGVYRSIRHPMYASIWLWCLAQGLMLENWLAGWYACFAFALMYFVRTPREDQMMCQRFGQEYRDYMQRTGPLFPKFAAGDGRFSIPAVSAYVYYGTLGLMFFSEFYLLALPLLLSLALIGRAWNFQPKWLWRAFTACSLILAAAAVFWIPLVDGKRSVGLALLDAVYAQSSAPFDLSMDLLLVLITRSLECYVVWTLALLPHSFARMIYTLKNRT